MISVIIPVHNTEKFLPRCLNSVLNGTYRDLEILLIENGSSDNSLNVCNEYAAEHNNIKVYTAEKTGVAHARNLGLRNASGEYISFIDSDDYISPYMYEALMNCILKNGADMAFCECETGNKNEFDFNFPQENCDRIISFNEYCYNLYVREEVKYSFVTNKLYKRNLLNKIQFNENISYAEDRNFIIQYISRCEKIVHLPDKHYYYFRGNAQSICNSSDMNTRIDQLRALQYDYEFSKGLTTDPPPLFLCEFIAICMLRTADFRLKQARGGFDGKNHPELVEKIKPFVRKSFCNVLKAKHISKKDKLISLTNHCFPSFFNLIYKIIR